MAVNGEVMNIRGKCNGWSLGYRRDSVAETSSRIGWHLKPLQNLPQSCLFGLWNKLHMIAVAPIRLLAAIGVVQMNKDSTLNVRGRYAGGLLSARRCLIAKLRMYRRRRLRHFECTFSIMRYPFPRMQNFFHSIWAYPTIRRA